MNVYEPQVWEHMILTIGLGATLALIGAGSFVWALRYIFRENSKREERLFAAVDGHVAANKEINDGWQDTITRVADTQQGVALNLSALNESVKNVCRHPDERTRRTDG